MLNSFLHIECINGRPGDKPYSTRHGDLWSLGVILLMLITGHSAWAHASLRTGRHRPDPSFALFVRRPKGFLSRMFPLSPSAEQLFLAVFAPNYRQRPTLEQLRMAIATSETFYLTDDEMALAPALLREFDADHRRCLLSPPCSPTASTRAIPPSPRAPTFPDVSPMPAFHLALDPFAPAPATAAARESSFEDVQLHAAPSALQKPKIQPVFVITNRTSRDLISPVSPVQPTAMSVAAKPASPVRPRAQPVLDLLAEEEERIDEGAWYLGSPPRRVRDDSSSEDRVFDRPMTPPTPPADMFVIGDDSDEESEGPVTPETYPVADVPVGKEAKVLGGAERLLSLLSI
jgi:serine/threonine protein kinase